MNQTKLMRHAPARLAWPLLLTFAGALTLLACGSDTGGGSGPASSSCAGSHTGTWEGVTIDDELGLTASCGFSYVGADGCRTAGRYENPLTPSGSVDVEITFSTGGNCLSTGSYVCEYDYDESTNELTFNCGAGDFLYRR